MPKQIQKAWVNKITVSLMAIKLYRLIKTVVLAIMYILLIFIIFTQWGFKIAIKLF